MIDLLKRAFPVWGNKFITDLTVKSLGLQGLRDRKMAEFQAERAERRGS